MNFVIPKGKHLISNAFHTAIIAIIPLSILHSEVYGINDYFISITLLFLLLTTCILNLTIKSSIKISILDILILCIFITSILSSLINEVSFHTTLNTKYIIYIFLLLLSKEFLHHRKLAVYLFYAIFIVNLYIICKLLHLLALEKNHINFIESSFGNTGVFSIYLSVSCILYCTCKIRKLNVQNYVHILIILANLFFITTFKSRISLILIIAFTSYLGLSKIKKIKIKHNIIVSIIILIFSVVFLSIYTKADSSQGRFLILKISKDILGDHLFKGTGGFNSYGTIYSSYQARYFSLNKGTEKQIMVADNVLYALNEPIQWGCELGIVGILLISFSVFILLKYIKDNKSCLVILLSIFVSSCFSYILHITIFQNLFFILLLIANSKIKPIFTLKKNATIFVIIILIFISSLVNCTIHKYSESLKLKYKIDNNIYLEDSLINNFKENQTFIYPYALQLFKTEKYNKCLEVLENIEKLLNHSEINCLKAKCHKVLNNYDEAEKNFRKASDICPNRFEYKYELYKLYIEIDQLEKAKKIAFSIRNMKEKIPSPYTMAVKLEIERFLQQNTNCF